MSCAHERIGRVLGWKLAYEIRQAFPEIVSPDAIALAKGMIDAAEHGSVTKTSVREALAQGRPSGEAMRLAGLIELERPQSTVEIAHFPQDS